MSSCNHTSWLNFSNAEEFILWDTGRLSRMLGELTNPARQRPSVILFVGRKAKDVALRELFAWNNIKRVQRDGLATLRADTLSLQSDFPVFFAESDPFVEATPQAPVPVPCHQVSPFPVSWTVPPPQIVYDIVHARIFCLFIDVLCIFADDFHDFEDVVSRLRAWAALGRATSQFDMARPKVVIVKQGACPGPSLTYDLLQSEHLHYNLSQAEFKNFFSSIILIYLADEQISSLSRHRRLKELVQRQTDEIRHIKQTLGCCFSALHLACFFTEAVKHTAQTITGSFDFLTSSRRTNPISAEFSEHLSEFLRLSSQAGLPQRVQTTFIASTILLDAYPPEMHCFDPECVYDVLYEPLCLQSLDVAHENSSLVRRSSKAIRDKLTDLFVMMQISARPAAVVHRQILGNMGVLFMGLRSNRICLCSLYQKPEHTLSCGHSLCDVCIRIFGRPVLEAEYSYVFDKCVLCPYGTLQITLKPPTAGTRILSIDGGGPRGVVPLEFLDILQERMGPECPIQDLFDVAFGTSSGGLIILGLFLRQWGITQCKSTFDTLTREFFGTRLRSGVGLWHGVRRLFRCWLSDGYYDASPLEATLKQHLSVHQRMFGPLPSGNAIKAAVTATTISDASPVIMSNYNGIRSRQPDSGYRHLRPVDVDDEPFVWQAGRATSAAPVLFQPAQISTLGTFQDGGLKHNNPINLALWESRNIWPSVNRPDIVVSLGTGTTVNDHSTSTGFPSFRNIISDGFVPRLWRSFMSSLDGQSTWRDLWNCLDDITKEDFFRANVYIPNDALAIDNVSRMDQLRDYVHTQPHNDRFRRVMPFALLVASFFFELSSQTLFQNGKVYCKGAIRCRLKGSIACQTLARVHPGGLIFMAENEIIGHFKGDFDLCPRCHRYQKEVDFEIRHPKENISIYFQSTDQGKRRISGFPQNIKWFQEQQYLDAHFGKPFHDSSRTCEQCNPQSRHRYSLLPKRRGGEHCSQGLSARKRRRFQ